jgi:prepilin-type N-terminal cleavage/methylation domain-containing protein
MKSRSGFTLIELLVVIAIIGLLATVSVVAFSNAQKKARDTRRMSDLRQISKIVELYYDENGQYPQPSRGWNTWSGHCPTYGDADEYILGVVPTYIGALPIDSKFDTGGYCYLYRSNGTDYMALAHQTMENICGGDPSNTCNPLPIQAMDRPSYTQPTIAVYSPGARTW